MAKKKMLLHVILSNELKYFVIVFMASTALILLAISDSINKYGKASNEATIKQTTAAILTYLQEGNYYSLKHNLDQLTSSEVLKNAVVFDHHGKKFSESGTNTTTLGKIKIDQSLPQKPNELSYQKIGTREIIVAHIYDSEGVLWGILAVEANNALSYYLLKNVSIILLISAVLLLFLHTMVSYKVVSKAIMPLRLLTNEVDSISTSIQNTSKNGFHLDSNMMTYIESLSLKLNQFTDEKEEIQILMFSFRKLLEVLITYWRLTIQNKSLASIGSSTAMVAHDVRKPLTSMKALLTSLPAIKDNPAELKKMISVVDGSIVHTNAMLNEILDFSRDSTALELNEHDPVGVITSALSDVLRNHPGSDVRIEYDLKHAHVLHVDGNRIIRVLTNIIDNALSAMTNGDGKAVGRLRVRTEEKSAINAPSPYPSPSRGEGKGEGDNIIRIIISDSGPGIPEDALPRLFDPFFTFGKKGGTGLGLAICKKVIDMHGGKIEARNACHPSTTCHPRENGDPECMHEIPAFAGMTEHGAEFIIELPAGEKTAAINESELINDSSELKAFREEEALREDSGGDIANTAEFMRINKERGRLSRMLIVDDEPLFRETIRYMLNGLDQVKDHIRVVEVDSAEKGLEMLAGAGDPSAAPQDDRPIFDYVIADIDLGKRKMNGYDFTQEILKKYPNTYVLIHSNKRKEELDIEIRVIASAAKQSPEPSCMREIASSSLDGLGTPRNDIQPRFLGFLPKPMKASELLQFLACRSFEMAQPHGGVIASRALNPLSASAWQSPEHNCMHGIASSPPAPRNDKKNVLLLNDDEGLNFSIGMTLKSQNMHVTDVTSVKDALQKLAKNKFDMIISDINLGEGQPNGYDFLKEVRKTESSVPFIFASGYSKAEEWPKASAAGATAYLQLPIDLKEMVEVFS